MEIVQLVLVAIAGFLSVRFLYKKFVAPKTTTVVEPTVGVVNLPPHQTFNFVNFDWNISH